MSISHRENTAIRKTEDAHPRKEKNEKGNTQHHIHITPGSSRDFRACRHNSRKLKKGTETKTAEGRFTPALQKINLLKIDSLNRIRGQGH